MAATMKPTWIEIPETMQKLTESDQMTALLLCLSIVIIIGFIYKTHYIVIRGDQVAVVKDGKGKTFAGFWSAGRYLLLPGREKLVGFISTSSESTQGSCTVSTQDGQMITLDWRMVFHLDPCSIDPTLQPMMALMNLYTL